MNKKNYISARDIAGDIRLNYELDKWFWMPYRKGCALRGMTVLFFLACFPSFAQAEQCTPTPDCKSLGYTETSCPNSGGVKCPWNTSLWHCDSGGKKDVCPNCKVGMILNSDGTCSAEKENGKTPIGVVAIQKITDMGAAVKCVGMAVALSDISSSMMWKNGQSQCNSYSASGVSGWHMPTKEELLAVDNNSIIIHNGLHAAGGKGFDGAYCYWTSSRDPNYSDLCYCVRPYNGDANQESVAAKHAVRPVLAF